METRYAVDRIEGDIIVLEELESRQLQMLSKSMIDFDVMEGDIITNKDGIYFNDKKAKEERLEQIKIKFNRVRRQK